MDRVPLERFLKSRNVVIQEGKVTGLFVPCKWLKRVSCVVRLVTVLLRGAEQVNSRSPGQEIYLLSWNSNVQCPHNSRLLYLNPVHTISACFCKTDSSFVVPSRSRYCKWSLLLRFSEQNHVRISHFVHACFMSPRLDLDRPNGRCAW